MKFNWFKKEPKPRWTPPEVIRVTVTQDHIKHGRPKKADFCPIALALKEQFNLHSLVSPQVMVGPTDVTIAWTLGRQAQYQFPLEAQEFVRKYDSWVSRSFVKPFTFTMKRWD